MAASITDELAAAAARLVVDDGLDYDAAKRKALVNHFGGLPGVAAASVEQLAQAPGISQALAETIYAALH